MLSSSARKRWPQHGIPGARRSPIAQLTRRLTFGAIEELYDSCPAGPRGVVGGGALDCRGRGPAILVMVVVLLRLLVSLADICVGKLGAQAVELVVEERVVGVVVLGGIVV